MLVPSPLGALRVVILSFLVGRRTGPETDSFLSTIYGSIESYRVMIIVVMSEQTRCPSNKSMYIHLIVNSELTSTLLQISTNLLEILNIA